MPGTPDYEEDFSYPDSADLGGNGPWTDVDGGLPWAVSGGTIVQKSRQPDEESDAFNSVSLAGITDQDFAVELTLFFTLQDPFGPNPDRGNPANTVYANFNCYMVNSDESFFTGVSIDGDSYAAAGIASIFTLMNDPNDADPNGVQNVPNWPITQYQQTTKSVVQFQRHGDVVSTIVNGAACGTVTAGSTLTFDSLSILFTAQVEPSSLAAGGAIWAVDKVKFWLVPNAAPSSLSAVPSGTTINLSWTAGATNYTTFTVQRSLDGSTGWTTVGSPTGNSFANTGLSATTKYYYRVAAANPAGVSSFSSSANATTGVPTPSGSGLSLGLGLSL